MNEVLEIVIACVVTAIVVAFVAWKLAITYRIKVVEAKTCSAEEKARDIKTTAGEVYGFTVGGKIYIYTDIATSETPIHEYAHLFVKALKITNKQAWERLKEGLRKEKDLLSYVKNKYKGITDEDVLLSEVFATYAGKAGRERMQTDLKKELSQT